MIRGAYLVDLTPFSSFLVHEARVYSGHNLIELLARFMGLSTRLFVS